MTNQIYNDRDGGYLATDPAEARRRAQRVAFVIGALAIGLATLVHLIDRAFGPACARDSISHYFYEPRAGVFFVMALTVVAAFLFTYRGERPLDNRLATVGAAAALLVAFFPTGDVGCDFARYEGRSADFRPALVAEVPQDLSPEGVDRFIDLTPTGPQADPPAIRVEFASATSSEIHGWSAVGLFLILLYFSAWAFPRKNAEADVGADGRFTWQKRFRNTIYFGCSAVMAFGALMTKGLVPPEVARPVYWGEAIFLGAFGVSWLVKSRLLYGSLGLRRWGG